MRVHRMEWLAHQSSRLLPRFQVSYQNQQDTDEPFSGDALNPATFGHLKTGHFSRSKDDRFDQRPWFPATSVAGRGWRISSLRPGSNPGAAGLSIKGRTAVRRLLPGILLFWKKLSHSAQIERGRKTAEGALRRQFGHMQNALRIGLRWTERRG